MSSPPTLEEGSVRRRPALLSALTGAALVAVVLAGCAPTGRGPGNQPAGCSPEVPTGGVSSTVTASGAIGSAPKATFPTPLVAKSDQATVLKAGHGAPAEKGAMVDLDVTALDARTGKSIAATSYDRSQFLRAVAGKGLPTSSGSLGASSIADALVCAQAGSRIALTTTAKRLNAIQGLANAQSVVAIIDVNAIYLGKANGANRLPQDGMPDVITAVDGQPGIVVQELQKPTTARSEVVKAGGGAVVKKNSKAVLALTAWTWPANGDKPPVVAALDTWTTGAATTLDLSQSGLPKKLTGAIVGQKVGSQVLVVLPPKEGFAAGSAPQGVTATDTLIFVVDILGIQK
jgi:hypothetical protein